MKFVTLMIPTDPTIISAARRIAVAFEPDSGIDPEVYDAFSTLCEPIPVLTDEEGNQTPNPYSGEWVAYGAPVSDDFAASVPLWKEYPDQLRLAVKAVLDVRWPEAPVPSLVTVKKFTDVVVFDFSDGIAAGVSALGFSIQEPMDAP